MQILNLVFYVNISQKTWKGFIWNYGLIAANEPDNIFTSNDENR
jgi:hypothetical protein